MPRADAATARNEVHLPRPLPDGPLLLDDLRASILQGGVKAISYCRSCREPIFWAVTSNGRRMPVDPLPVPSGNVLIASGTRSFEAYVLGATAASGALEQGVALHFSHFTTCPQASDHRRHHE
jgi:hypothetical protein